MNISPRILIVACVVLFILNGVQRGIYNSRSRKYESSEEAYLLKIDKIESDQALLLDSLMISDHMQRGLERTIITLDSSVSTHMGSILRLKKENEKNISDLRSFSGVELGRFFSEYRPYPQGNSR